MKLQALLVFLCIAINTNAQLSFLNQSTNFFGNPRSGFEKENLKNTTLLVATLEDTGRKCGNQSIITEYGFHILEPVVPHCPYDKITKQQKKQIKNFNNQLTQRQEDQAKIWKAYDKPYQFVSNTSELSKYDKKTHRFMLSYQYVAAFNQDQDSYYAIRYQLYDRLNDKQYAALETLNADTDLKRLNNLEQVIEHLKDADNLK